MARTPSKTRCCPPGKASAGSRHAPPSAPGSTASPPTDVSTRAGQPTGARPRSAGERQRLKLATTMGGDGSVYILDEPTTGLHLADVEQLLGLLDRLVDSGKSVIVIEHHQAVMAHADWIIDLGPGAGHDGGRIVFEGTPAEHLTPGPRGHRETSSLTCFDSSLRSAVKHGLKDHSMASPEPRGRRTHVGRRIRRHVLGHYSGLGN